jgi:hypothetical protein
VSVGLKKIKAIEVTCDGCGAVQVVSDLLDIIGYNGVVAEQHAGGGTGSVKFFACVSKCLELAIKNAIDNAYNYEEK